jgi:precorrin-6Y C5,15-methyltransferase (decarboxylating)
MRIDSVGAGAGPGSLTRDGAEAARQAELVVGSARLVAAFARAGQAQVVAARPVAVVAAIEASPAARIAVLMSGDVGFHSGAAQVAAALRETLPRAELRLIPGVSAVAALAARLGAPWEDACLVSCHGTGADLVAPVRRNRRTIALTGGNVGELAAALSAAGFGALACWAGEDLGMARETISATTVNGLAGREWSPLTTLLIENPAWDARALSGLPDESFERGAVPMTKSAVRAVALARLAVRPADVCWDIGCGTGSVTVELALAAYAGRVFGIDRNPAAVALTRQNCRAFHIGNVTVEEGLAPAGIEAWPRPDAVFVGGSAGRMRELVAAAVERNPGVRVVVTAIAVESAAAALAAVLAAGLVPEVTQLSVARGRQAGGLHLMTGLNPVTIVAGGGDG